MPPKNKAKAAGVSASSFLDLKAELSKHEDAISKSKAGGAKPPPVAVFGGPSKKPTVWARPNKGVKGRAARDVELEAVSRPTLESARAALERKAKIYEKLKKGKSGGLSDAQYDALLVDFDAKEGDSYESDSDDEDESLTVPAAPGQDDPVIEYEDEFGRARSARRSEVPRHLLPPSASGSEDDPIIEYEDEFGRMRTARRSEVPREFLKPTIQAVPEDDPSIIYNPAGHFPVYEPSAARTAQIQTELAAATGPQNVHYDAAREVRARGAGFYQFSADADARERQMAELRAGRTETARAREEGGALDVRPGEVEGLRAPDDGAVGRSRAMEKRKREIEERRRAVEAKRRKVRGGAPEEDVPQAAAAPGDVDAAPAEQESFAGAQAASMLAPGLPVRETTKDPFAALEAQATRKGDSTPTGAIQQADDFLAQLERDMLQGRS